MYKRKVAINLASEASCILIVLGIKQCARFTLYDDFFHLFLKLKQANIIFSAAN